GRRRVGTRRHGGCGARSLCGSAVHLQSRSRHLAGDADRPRRADAGEGAGVWRGGMTTGGRSRTVRAGVALAVTAGRGAILVLWLPEGFYDWVKALHIMAVISWMAGMFYLPRLFVYHCGAEPGSKQSETFKVMEYRLLTQIINPAMVVTWVTGVWLISAGKLIFPGRVEGRVGLGPLPSRFHVMAAAV